MAKLKAPLMSFGASGKIADALVFFTWKGLNVVREYVIPSNPKTAGQTTQRSYLTDAVAAIHTAQSDATNPLTGTDVSAYALWASVVRKATTWFNQAVKNWVDVLVSGNTPVIYSDATVTDPDPLSIDMILYLNEETPSDLAAGKFYFGTSKTALINSFVATVVAGVSVAIVAGDLSAFLSSGVKYFWQFRPDSADPCEGANSGIYYFVAT